MWAAAGRITKIRRKMRSSTRSGCSPELTESCHFCTIFGSTLVPQSLLTTVEIYLSANYEIPLNRYQLLWYFLTER